MISQKARKEHEKFLRRMRVRPRDKSVPVVEFPDYNVSKPGLAPTSDRVGGCGANEDKLLAHKWKRGREEPQDVVKEMVQKSKQIGIAYNKGGYSFISISDVKHLGKK